MKRYLGWLAVLGIAAVPDWASACWPRWDVYCYPPPVCPPPIYALPVCPPPVFVTPPVYPPFPGPLTPPRVEAVPRMAVPAPAPAPSGGSSGMETGATPGLLPGAKASPASPPGVEATRPTGGSDRAVSPAGGAPKADPPTGTPNPKFPVVEIPKRFQLDPKEPLAEPPKGTTADPRPPVLQLPKDPDPGPAVKPPALELPKDPPASAAPGPAPAPSDSLVPSAPLMPDAKKPEGLPPLILPPDNPAPPSKSGSTSRSSPLTGTRGELKVNVFPAAGSEHPRGGYRTVGFYNHTDRDLALTIEGRAVKLPAKTYLHAKLGPVFSWSYAGRPATRQTVPEGATGLDVLFRD